MHLRILIALLVCAVALDAVAQDIYARPEALAWSKRFGEAEVEYRSLLRGRPEDWRLRSGLARVILWSGRYREAERHFETLHAERPESGDVLLGLAQAAYWSGDYRRAARWFREILRRSPENEEAAKSLRDLAALAVARYEISTQAVDDSQPFDSQAGRARVSFFSDPLTRWDVMAGVAELEGGDSPARSFGAGLRAGLPRLRAAVAASLESFQFPNGDRTPIGSFSLARETPWNGDVTAGIERTALLSTASSAETSATATRLWTSWQRDFSEKYLAGATAYVLDYSDDNRGAGADVYFLAPVLPGFRAGVSAAWRDTESSSFRFTGFESDRSNSGFRYRFTGVYEVYWTPQDYRDLRAVAGYEWRWLKLQADAGVGRERAVSFGPSEGPTAVPAFTFPLTIERSFQPWRASAEISLPLRSGLELRARLRHDVTSFYRANEFQASLVGRF